MRQIILLLLTGLVILSLAGCARFPAAGVENPAPPRTIYSEIDLRGPSDPNCYYFFALGTDQTNATGPVPIVTGIGNGNSWGTISPLPSGEEQEPPFYVQYHTGTDTPNAFAQFRHIPGQPVEYLGAPYRAGVSADGTRIWVEIDQRLLDPLLGTATNPYVQVNWITLTTLSSSVDPSGISKEYDGFGPSGNDYFPAGPITVTQTWRSGENGIVAEPAEDTATTPAIDMVGWAIETRIRTAATGSAIVGE